MNRERSQIPPRHIDDTPPPLNLTFLSPPPWALHTIPSGSPLIDENNTRVPTKEEAAALKMKPGSARDLHKDHIAALSAKQGTDPEPSPVLGPRGGDRGRGGSDARREGPGWGDRGDRDWDRFGDR